MMELAGFQRKYLRGLAHALRPVVQIGRLGLTDDAIQAVQAALAEHELIKVGMQKPKDKKGMAAEIALRSESLLCGLVGHTVILYRPHPDTPTLRIPKRDEASTEIDADSEVDAEVNADSEVDAEST